MNLSFTTKKECQEYIEKFIDNDEIYYLRHGEYERPEYSARRYKDGWGIHGSYFYYQGTLYAEEDGRVSFDFICYKEDKAREIDYIQNYYDEDLCEA